MNREGFWDPNPWVLISTSSRQDTPVVSLWLHGVKYVVRTTAQGHCRAEHHPWKCWSSQRGVTLIELLLSSPLLWMFTSSWRCEYGHFPELFIFLPAFLWKSLRISSIWRFPTHRALRGVARNPSRAAFHATICLRKSASNPGQIAWNTEEQQMNKSQRMWERKKWPKLGVVFPFFNDFFFFFWRINSNVGLCFGLVFLLKRKKAKPKSKYTEK